MIGAIRQISESAYALARQASPLRSLVADHLAVDPAGVPVVAELLPSVERPNLQLALDSVLAEQPESRLIGLPPEIVQYGVFSLAAVLAGRFPGPSDPAPPTYDDLPTGVDTTIPCVTAGVWLIQLDGIPVVVGLTPGEMHQPPSQRQPKLEVFSVDPSSARATLRELARRRHELNVYRAQMLAFSFSEYGDFGIRFTTRPEVAADDVILPSEDFDAIHRHAIGTSIHAGALRANGRHLKRGMLLYGPPGTGKTHTVGYLAAAMPQRTVVVLQGPSVGALGQAAAIVRSLAPSMLVIEDVDLIAHARGMPHMDTNPLLFQLLNEMDGLTPTDDVLFVLTTNRLDLLEPALVARPGRIDQAVEIRRPDADGRRRLFELYLRDCAHEVTDLAPIVDRTDGVTASFIKEVIRRAVLDAASTGEPAILESHLTAATDELLDRSIPIGRAVLGAESTHGVAGDAH